MEGWHEAGQIPHEFATVMKYVMLSIMAVIYVLIPGVLVLFYQSKHVNGDV